MSKGKYKRNRGRHMSVDKTGQQSANAKGESGTPDNKDPKGKGDVPVIPELEPAPTHGQISNSCKPDSTPAWKIIVQAGTFFAGIIVAIIYGLQLNAMIEANRISRTSLQAVQRAFVSFSPNIPNRNALGPNLNSHQVQFWDLAVPLRNDGNTVVKHGRLYVNENVPPKGQAISENFDFTDKDAIGKVVPGPFVLGPKQSTYTRTMEIPISTVRAVYEKRAHLYVYGWADYQDVFNFDRVTKFCYELARVGISDKTHELEAAEWSLCQKSNGDPLNNCMDEECTTE
jgi:hypothetical protein